jgi:hypothetical protein
MTSDKRFDDYLLPGLPVERIKACYARAAGNEIDSGKFFSEESSAGLAANAFGFFLDRPADLPPLPEVERAGWPALRVELEEVVRFPWSGGRHPCLDVLIETDTSLIGVESKRYEPFRTKSAATLSDAYWREVWGNAMSRYERVRDELRGGLTAYKHLDAAQLVKHAFGLRTAVNKSERYLGRAPLLFYLFAEPEGWPDRRVIAHQDHEAHREEIRQFGAAVDGDEVKFVSCSYAQLLAGWGAAADKAIAAHAEAVTRRFFGPVGAT